MHTGRFQIIQENSRQGYIEPEEDKTQHNIEEPRSRKPPKHDKAANNQKKFSHILSEQKRREHIRNGFEDLSKLVPSLRGVRNSKSTILYKSKDSKLCMFLRDQLRISTAADYVQYLQHRNHGLLQRLTQLTSSWLKIEYYRNTFLMVR